jgi:hypothetical protein
VERLKVVQTCVCTECSRAVWTQTQIDAAKKRARELDENLFVIRSPLGGCRCLVCRVTDAVAAEFPKAVISSERERIGGAVRFIATQDGITVAQGRAELEGRVK